MNILLQKAETGAYYAGQGAWVEEPGRGASFESVDAAAEVWQREVAGDAQVVLWYTDPPCELRLPIRSEWFGEREFLRLLRFSDS